MTLHSLVAKNSVTGGSGGEGMSVTLEFLIQPLFSCKENFGVPLPRGLDLDVRKKLTRIYPAEYKKFLKLNFLVFSDKFNSSVYKYLLYHKNGKFSPSCSSVVFYSCSFVPMSLHRSLQKKKGKNQKARIHLWKKTCFCVEVTI